MKSKLTIHAAQLTPHLDAHTKDYTFQHAELCESLERRDSFGAVKVELVLNFFELGKNERIILRALAEARENHETVGLHVSIRILIRWVLVTYASSALS
jgi:hypothetical protein